MPSDFFLLMLGILAGEHRTKSNLEINPVYFDYFPISFQANIIPGIKTLTGRFNDTEVLNITYP